MDRKIPIAHYEPAKFKEPAAVWACMWAADPPGSRYRSHSQPVLAVNTFELHLAMHMGF